jgi:hypothetical protein
VQKRRPVVIYKRVIFTHVQQIVREECRRTAAQVTKLSINDIVMPYHSI